MHWSPEWLTVIVTTIYCVISFFTFLVLRDQAALLKRQADANETSSNAADRNAEFYLNSERARLLDTAEITREFDVEIFVTNCGRSPAHITHAFVSADWVRGRALPKKPDYADFSDDPEVDYATSRWVLPNEKVSIGWEDSSTLINSDPELKESILKGKTTLWAFGRFRYQDTISGNHYESRFCYSISHFIPGHPMIHGGGPPEYLGEFKML
jgi:hypothetical protein